MKYAGIGQRLVQEPLFLTLQPDGSDTWRLEPVIQILRDGGVRERVYSRPSGSSVLTVCNLPPCLASRSTFEHNVWLKIAVGQLLQQHTACAPAA